MQNELFNQIRSAEYVPRINSHCSHPNERSGATSNSNIIVTLKNGLI